MYTIDSRVRFSEVDHNETITLPGIINYFQDCSTFHSEDIGLGMDYLKERGKVWILSSWQVVVERYPVIGERIDVSTWATGFQGLFGTRNFRMRDEQKNTVAYANSVWVFMDVKKGRPARPGVSDIEKYGTEPALDMDYASRKIALPENALKKDTFPVRKYHIDRNEHVNNCQYVQMALEVLEKEMKVKQVRVEYKKSAVYNDIILPKVAEEKGRTIVELCDMDEKPYAVVELIGEA